MTIDLLGEALSTYETALSNPDEREHFESRQIERMTKEIGNSLVMDFPREVRLLSSMSVFSSWQGMTAVSKIARGDGSGWHHLHLCYSYRAWTIRTRVASGDRVKKTKGLLLRDGIASALGHAICMGDLAFAKWCGNRVISSFKNREGAFTNKPYGTPFEPFLFQLYAVWQGDPIDLQRFPGCDLGPYRGIAGLLKSNTEELEAALLVGCDYHCDRHGFGEYGNVPYVHFPVEILTVLVIRELLGLSVPHPEHPLLGTQFAAVPKGFAIRDDPLLLAVEAKIREAHPEIGYPW
jgi:hypothetical protein